MPGARGFPSLSRTGRDTDEKLPLSILIGRHRLMPSARNKLAAAISYRWWRTVLYSILGLSFLSYHAWATNRPDSLNLDPASTVLAILDSKDGLASPRNQRLFNEAGFNVAVLNDCNHDNEQRCLLESLLDAKRRFSSQYILLVTSARHSQAVYSIYKSKKTSALLSGVILFQADRSFMAQPMGKTLSGPPLLLIAEETDDRDIIQASRRFADHVRDSGTWSWFVMLPRQPNPEKRDALLTKMVRFFAGRLQKNDALFEILDSHSRWQHPPLDHNGFFAHPDLVRPYSVDGSFGADMDAFFERGREQLKQWKLETFYGFDLLAYRDKSPATKRMRYLVLRNHKGQLSSIDLDVYAEYSPVIVVGVDHERNLFRLNALYRLKARYSWIKDKTPIGMSVNPLGAFLHFRKPLPARLKLPLHARSVLSHDSVAFTNKNPLAGLEKLPPKVQKTVTRNCIFCHSLDGAGGRAHHLAAATAEPQGGFALPLRSYSKEVLESFLFDQERVAKSFGVVPNRVPADNAKALYEFLTAGE